MKKIIILLLLALPLSVGCSNKQNSSDAKNKSAVTLASVGGQKIRSDQFEAMFNQATFGRPPGSVPKDGVLDNMVRLELGALEAAQEKIDQDPVIAFKIKGILTEALLKKNVLGTLQGLNVADEEAKEYYEKNPRRRASQILLRVPPDADQNTQAEIKKRVDDIYQQAIANKKSFPELAKKYSEGPTAKNGGDLDYFPKRAMTPEIAEAAFALKEIGEISPPVKNKDGWHIIQLTGKRSFKDEDQNALKEAMMGVKRAKVVNDYFASLEKKHETQLYSDRLGELNPKP